LIKRVEGIAIIAMLAAVVLRMLPKVVLFGDSPAWWDVLPAGVLAVFIWFFMLAP
jgi:hypothetical protein